MSKRSSSTAADDAGTRSPKSGGDLLIVGIGASAGGVEALSIFFENVPAESGIAYVVILHLSPDYESRLAEVLQRVSSIPVEQVTKKTKVRPDHVYVVPPDKHLEMSNDSILVKPVETDEERRAPVDIFFRTLASTHGANAVAVILSGTGANGSMGLKRVKEFGGAVFVQNPREAEYSEMPRNAITTEMIDAVLPIAQIPAAIVTYRNKRGSVAIPDEPTDREVDDQRALREIFLQLRMRTGHDFSNYKRPTMLRRIERRISVLDLPDIRSYASYLHDHPEEPQALLRDLLISVTNFFRDKKAFEALETRVLPDLFEGRPKHRPVRIWIPGCATGEDAYSIAMMAAELTMGDIERPPVQIFATDIDEQAIAVAREGVYTASDAADLSPERLRRFFTKVGESYRIRREIREMVLFAQHNLIKDPPFSHLDLVSCRNLLIYLNHSAQERVMETVHFALRPGGYLFIGASETVDGSSDLFKAFDKEHRIYRSRQVTSRPFPVPESVPVYRAASLRTEAVQKKTGEAVDRITYNDLHLRLLEEFAPPSLVVNEEYEVVHLSPRAGRYLHVVGGEPSSNLLRLIRPELRLEARTALFQAAQQQTNVEVQGLKVRIGDQDETIDLLIRPVLGENDIARGFILVIFRPAASDGRSGAARPEDYVAPEPVARQLEEELIRSRTQLQAALEQAEVQAEELRASNEELQAMNEELRSSAEELETSKEELQSINKELTTVNQELKVNIEELSHTNNNFQNLVNSIDIGTIFLDRSLRVNLFSPAAREVFNLLPADVGRPLTDITGRIEYAELDKDADRVLETLQPVEREVTGLDGRVHLLRIFPYRTSDDRINGVVLTFVDITDRKRAEQALAESEEQFRRAIEDAPIPVIMHAEDGEVLQVSRTWTELTGYTIKDVPTVDAWLTRAYGEGAESVRSHMQELFRGRRKTDGIEFPIRTRSGETRYWSFSASSPGTLRDGRRFIVGMAVDITERMRTDEALRQSEQRARLLIESASDYAILTLDPDRRVTSWSSGAEALLGYADSEIVGRTGDILFTPEDRKKGEPLREAQTARDEGRAQNERWHLRKDGTYFWGSGSASPIRDGSGKLIGFVKILRDLTERRKAQEAQSADLDATSLLLQLGARLVTEADIQTLYDEVMAAAIRLTRADAGTVQIFDARTRELVLLATSGFDSKLTDRFRRVDAGSGTSCGVALRTGKRSFVDFDPDDPEITSRLHVEAGLLSAQSTPLVSRSGERIGMLSTHWRRAGHRPSERELEFLDLLARQAADFIEQRQAEEKLRRAAELDAFRVELTDALRPLSDPQEIQSAACRALGEHLRVDRTYFVEVNEADNFARVERDYTRGASPSLAGDFQLDEVGWSVPFLRRGEMVVVRDVRSSDLVPDADRGWMAELQIAAHVSVPINKTGALVGALCVTESAPRDWTDTEIELVRETAERIWEAVDRARAEAALRASEEKYRSRAAELHAVLESMSDAVYIGSAEGIKIANQAALDQLGYSTLDELNRSVDPLAADSQMRDAETDQVIPAESQPFARALRGERVTQDVRVRHRAAGRDRIVRSSAAPVMIDGKIVAAVTVNTDITELKRAQFALAASEGRIRMLMDSFADVAIFTTDPNGIVQLWNPGAEKIFGFTADELVGKRSGDIVFTPEDIERGAPDAERATAVRDGKAPDDRWHIRKSGERFFASGLMVPLTDGEGKLIGYGKIASDLTERKRYEDELREAREQLEARVVERTAELSQANASLRRQIADRKRAEAERIQLLRQIVTTQEDERRRIARDLHDQMGQRLTALRLQLALLRQHSSDDKIRSEVERLQELGERIDAEVNFLAWELRPTVLDDLGLVTAVENFVREWSGHFGIAAEFHSTGLAKKRLESEIETNLYRIAQEALNNVYKHAGATRVNVLLELRRKEVVLIVEDDGVGFDIEGRGNAQAQNADGMGLLGMQERAAIVGGSVEIETAPDHGTTVFARIPARFVKKDEGPGAENIDSEDKDTSR
ncbi:MAG: PAS domain S-box protein [Pyrinomonadaceae bacterium]